MEEGVPRVVEGWVYQEGYYPAYTTLYIPGLNLFYRHLAAPSLSSGVTFRTGFREVGGPWPRATRRMDDDGSRVPSSPFSVSSAHV